MIALLLLVQLEALIGRYPLEPVVAMRGETRTYHRVALAEIGRTTWTHVETCGTVTLVKVEADGDLHLRVAAGAAFIVVEVVPYHPLPRPRVGQMVRLRGISRIDRTHGWAEVHPLEAWSAVRTCKT